MSRLFKDVVVRTVALYLFTNVTLAQTQTPTTSSTAASVSSLGWQLSRIGNATIVFSDARQDNEVLLFYNISHSRQPMISVYGSGCDSTVSDDVVDIFTDIQPTNNSQYDILTVSLDIKQDTVQNSTIWTDEYNAGTIDMCVRVELVHDIDGDNNTDSITFQETEMSLTVGMTQGFALQSASVERPTPTVENRTAEVQYNLIACQCNADEVCEQKALSQNSELRICVSTSSADVKIETFSFMYLDQGSMTFIAIADGVNNDLTNVDIGTNEQSAVITTQLISAFFTEEDPENILCSGLVILTFADTSGRKLRKLVNINSEREIKQTTTSKGAFEVGVELESMKMAETDKSSAYVKVGVNMAVAVMAFSLFTQPIL